MFELGRSLSRWSVALAGVSLLASAAVLTGCRNEMYDQEKYIPLRGSQFYSDSNSSRPLIKEAVPRGTTQSRTYTNAGGLTKADRAVFDPTVGAYRDNRYDTLNPAVAVPTPTAATAAIPTMQNPLKINRQVLARGQERFNIYCSPCHGRNGDGQGMIVQRGMPAPPSFHIDRLRTAPDGHFFDVMTNGFGKMYSYAARIHPDDRWAIIAYIRALELSKDAKQSDVASK